jgi:hypothetical protein
VVLVSLGTGYVAQAWEFKEARNWGKVEWIKPLIDIMFDGQSQTVAYALGALFASANAAKQYVRLDTELRSGDAAAMDNATPKNLTDLRRAGEALVDARRADIARIVTMLR